MVAVVVGGGGVGLPAHKVIPYHSRKLPERHHFEEPSLPCYSGGDLHRSLPLGVVLCVVWQVRALLYTHDQKVTGLNPRAGKLMAPLGG